jgi:hypothetical protein
LACVSGGRFWLLEILRLHTQEALVRARKPILAADRLDHGIRSTPHSFGAYVGKATDRFRSQRSQVLV